MFLNMTDESCLTLLIKNRRRTCADPLDKIFGILALAPPKIRAKISPTYDQSPETVYKFITLELIQSQRRLDAISPCKYFTRFSGAPTWVPTGPNLADLSQTKEATYLLVYHRLMRISRHQMSLVSREFNVPKFLPSQITQ